MIWRGWPGRCSTAPRPRPDTGDDGFEERALWLGTTFGGAGRLHADLTPACAAALTVVLEALGQRAGPEDTRTAAQRRHDAIEEACRRLIGGQMIGGRDGQPPHLSVHIDLGDLTGLRGGSVLERSWTPARAAAGPGSAYLTGPAAEAAACDAVLTTIVTGQIDWQVLDQLTTVWLTAHGHRHADHPQEDTRAAGRRTTRTGRRKTTRTGRRKATRTAGRKATRAGRKKTTRTGSGKTTRTGRGKAATRTSQPPAPATSWVLAPARSPAPARAPAPYRAPAARAAGTAGYPAAWQPPGNGCTPRSCAGAWTCCPGPAGSPRTCAAPSSAPPLTPPASR